MQIGDRVRKNNSPIVGKVIDIYPRYAPYKAQVAWKMKYNGKFYMSTKWIRINKLISNKEPLPKQSWLKKLFHRLRNSKIVL